MSSVNKYNGEHYADPTAFAALSAIEKDARKKPFRPMVYICSPYAGAVNKNVENARRYCRFAVDHGRFPIAPHLLFPQFMDDENKDERELAMFFGLILLGRCFEVWVFGTHYSKGMKIEMEKARALGTPIRFFSKDCEVLDL